MSEETKKKVPRVKTLKELKEHNKELKVRKQELLLEEVSRTDWELFLEEVIEHIAHCLRKRELLKGRRSRQWLRRTVEFWEDFVQDTLGYIPLLEYQALGSTTKLSKEAEKQRHQISMNLVSSSVLSLETAILGSFNKLFARHYPQPGDPLVTKMIRKIRTGVS
jgi:hypothetical protein